MTRHAHTPVGSEWTSGRGGRTNIPTSSEQHDTETRPMTTEDTTTTGVSETDSTRARTTRGRAGTTRTTATSTRTGETGRERQSPATMGAVDQTNPYTNRSLGFAVYGRGVAADGGRRQSEESMEDVDHESDTDGTDRTFERGTDDSDE